MKNTGIIEVEQVEALPAIEQPPKPMPPVEIPAIGQAVRYCNRNYVIEAIDGTKAKIRDFMRLCHPIFRDLSELDLTDLQVA